MSGSKALSNYTSTLYSIQGYYKFNKPSMKFPIQSIKDRIKWKMAQRLDRLSQKQILDPNDIDFECQSEWYVEDSEGKENIIGFHLQIIREINFSLRFIIGFYHEDSQINIDFEIYEEVINDIPHVNHCLWLKYLKIKEDPIKRNKVDFIDLDHSLFRKIGSGFKFKEIYTLLDCLVEKKVLIDY